MKPFIITIVTFLLISQQSIFAQIHDIKVKSQENKSKISTNNVDFSSTADIASDIAGCCMTSIFDMLVDGCLLGLTNVVNNGLENNSNTHSDITTHDDINNDYYYNEPILTEANYETLPRDVKSKKFFLNINALCDISMHKGDDKNYLHLDYLPEIRLGWKFIMLDFRFNILTQLDADFVDAFKSWELLLMTDLTAFQDYSLIIGTGIHREMFLDGMNFQEFIVSGIIPINENKNNIDISSRFSVHYDTGTFPFVELNARYNQRLFGTSDVATYLTIGVTYQNYYESYDIFGIRTGIVIHL